MASTYRIGNHSAFSIAVVMDTNKESHAVPAAGSAVFVRANPGDRPTFHVYFDQNGDGSGERFICDMKVGYWDALRAEGNYAFNGSELS